MGEGRAHEIFPLPRRPRSSNWSSNRICPLSAHWTRSASRGPTFYRWYAPEGAEVTTVPDRNRGLEPDPGGTSASQIIDLALGDSRVIAAGEAGRVRFTDEISSILSRRRRSTGCWKAHDLITRPRPMWLIKAAGRVQGQDHSHQPALADGLHIPPHVFWAGGGAKSPWYRSSHSRPRSRTKIRVFDGIKAVRLETVTATVRPSVGEDYSRFRDCVRVGEFTRRVRRSIAISAKPDFQKKPPPPPTPVQFL